LSVFLTSQQLERLTGHVRPSAQARWLTERGWRHDFNAKGEVVVHELEAERKLCSGGAKDRRRTEPDLKALQ
jgi:hypothetical protein